MARVMRRYAVESKLRRIPARLRRVRVGAGLTIFELAARTGLSAMALASRESARSFEHRDDTPVIASLRHLYIVADACGVDVVELLA